MGTPSSATPWRTEPAGAHSRANPRRRAASTRCTADQAVAAALRAAATRFAQRPANVAQRRAVISSQPERQERELIKLAWLAAAMADALRRRGVREPAASLTAEAGITVFRVAFGRWTEERCRTDLSKIISESFEDLKAVTAGA